VCVFDSTGCMTVAVLNFNIFKGVYLPRNPDANEEGYVTVPNIDTNTERVIIADSLAARRAIAEIIAKFDPSLIMPSKGSRYLYLELISYPAPKPVVPIKMPSRASEEIQRVPIVPK